MSTNLPVGCIPSVWQRDQVVIAAAVGALFGDRARVRCVRATFDATPGNWTRYGRVAIQTSHFVAAPLIRIEVDRALERT